MCLVLLALQEHKDYPVIIAANRDEFYARPSQSMHWWPDNHLLAGKDLQAGGTWLGLAKNGGFATVTNYREMSADVGRYSRGQLALQWLQHDSDALSFSQALPLADYAGFNLLFGNIQQQRLYHISNRSNGLQAITCGFYGLSNALLDSPWPKVTSAKPIMAQLTKKPFQVDDWFALLADKTTADAHLLPDTGVDAAIEHLLSSRFIQSADYGTRCSTIICLDTEHNIHVYERSFDPLGQVSGNLYFQL